jgi:glycosyltransferase involved in cell wall biosynthesis
MTAERPSVSAIITVYNCEKYLAEAIESVLAQALPALELIVIDDGSSDRSGAIARGYSRVRYHFQQNRGIGGARNAGLERARGEFIAFLDSDDLWLPDKLAVQLARFAADPGLGIVVGHVEQFHSPEIDPTVARRIYCPPGALPGYAFGAMLIRRGVFDRVGGVATDRDKAEGVDWFLRAKDMGIRSHLGPEVVLRRRLHGANHSILHRESNSDYARALKESLDRRRKMRLEVPPASPGGDTPSTLAG